MASDDERNPFTRLGFIAASVVIAVVVVLGVVIVTLNSRHDGGPDTVPSLTTSAPAPASSPADDSQASVCGLEGVKLSGTVMTAPVAAWEYIGTVAYPTSQGYGPGSADPAGFQYCFQHSPEGALFAAAHAIAAGSDPDNKAWIEYFAAPGPHRAELIDGSSADTTSGTRLTIAGFRVLAYDGKKASVDLGGNGSTASGSITFSAVYQLVWDAGDWKVSTQTATPFDFASIPNLAGYVPWGP